VCELYNTDPGGSKVSCQNILLLDTPQTVNSVQLKVGVWWRCCAFWNFTLWRRQ